MMGSLNTRIRKEDLAEARVRMYRDLVFQAGEKVFAHKGFSESRMEDIEFAPVRTHSPDSPKESIGANRRTRGE